MEENNNNGELGLIDILQVIGQWIVNGFKKLTEWFLFLFFFGLKRWKFLAAASILIIGFSVFSFIKQDQQFKASMIVRSNAMDAQLMKSYFDSYSSLLDNGLMLSDNVTSQSGLTEEQRSLVASVSTYYSIDEDRDGVSDRIDFNGKSKSSDENLDSLNLCVVVNFEDVNVLNDLRESIINYVSNVDHVSNVNKSRIKERTYRRDFILNELALLDSMQVNAYNSLSINDKEGREANHVFVDNRKSLIYEDKELLLQELETVQRELDIYSEPLTVIDQFVVEKSAVNSFISITKENLLKGLICVYLLLFIIFIYNKVKGQYMTEDAE